MYAAGACKEARLMFSPPRELGREAFNQDHSGRGPPARSDRASSMVLSKAKVACWMWLGGLVRRAKATLGRERQDRRRVASILTVCGSKHCKTCKHVHECST